MSRGHVICDIAVRDAKLGVCDEISSLREATYVCTIELLIVHSERHNIVLQNPHPTTGMAVYKHCALRDAVSFDPKFARFSDTTVRTIFANDPGLQARHKKTN
jgi:hypothetical protein